MFYSCFWCLCIYTRCKPFLYVLLISFKGHDGRSAIFSPFPWYKNTQHVFSCMIYFFMNVLKEIIVSKPNKKFSYSWKEIDNPCCSFEANIFIGYQDLNGFGGLKILDKSFLQFLRASVVTSLKFVCLFQRKSWAILVARSSSSC